MDSGHPRVDVNSAGNRPVTPVRIQGLEQRLALLCGHSKAKVLLALSQPTTTTELAKLIHNSPSAVSQILHRLLRAGVVEQHRQGRQVLYRRSRRGQQLVQLL